MKKVGICSLFFYLQDRCPCGKCYSKSVVNNTYINMIESIGAIPIIIPVTDNINCLKEYINMIDVLLICGNKKHIQNNIIPDNIEKNELIQDIIHERDTLLLDLAIKNKKKVIGICYGMQFINSFLNGIIYLNIKDDLHKNNHFDTNHDIIIKKNTLLNELLKIDKIYVNSFHYAGILEDNLSKKLTISSISEDNIIESFESELLYGFQFHIELLKEYYFIIKKIIN